MEKKCQRCGGTLKNGFTTSMFNTDTICLDCKEKERKHPLYKEACDAESNAVKNVNYNFEGIGYQD